MAKAIIVGGGIVGLSSAYYLKSSGWEVTIIDKGNFNDNCSYGNAGYVCPSHFVPLASPGIIKQGLRWMLNPESPFYVKPRLDAGLISWGLKFMRSATPGHLERSAVPLKDIATVSKMLYEEWNALPGFSFGYAQKGLLEYFQTDAKEAQAHHHAHEAKALGLDAKVLNAQQVQAMEPYTKLNVRGALFFDCDAHLYPNLVMQQMQNYLRQLGVQFISNAEVTAFEKQQNRITKVIANNIAFDADEVVIATGAWSRAVAKHIGIKLAIVGGRGYSMNFEENVLKLVHPAVLMEGRVALTPLSDGKTRIGGTMEITSLNAPPRPNRVRGIIQAARAYFPETNLQIPSMNGVWYGYRPCSADGLPFIGRTNHYSNCIIASGHSMVGMSLGPATGKLVSEIANEQQTSVDIAPYNVHRFD